MTDGGLAFAACDVAALRARAQLYGQIRQFFAVRSVLEVETPLLSQAATTDVQLSSIAAQRHVNGQLKTHYLHTSPEFAMKRLLASGFFSSDDNAAPDRESAIKGIYQICKVFRDDEHGRKHNSEFSMLEWYRPQFDLAQLMNETYDLLKLTLAQRFDSDWQPQILSYKQAFLTKIGLNPLHATLNELQTAAARFGLDLDLGDDRLGYLDLLFSHLVEPTLGENVPLFLIDFPPEMAALAKHRQDSDGETVAARFEVYSQGLELANGYDELTDAAQLQARFEQDNAERQARGLPAMPIDRNLLAALPHLPPCAGIALGLDRLLMVAMNRQRLDDVLAFPAARA